MASKFKKGDRVIVIAGEQRPRKGQDGSKRPVTGQILKVYPDEQRVLVSGVNMVKLIDQDQMTDEEVPVSDQADIISEFLEGLLGKSDEAPKTRRRRALGDGGD